MTLVDDMIRTYPADLGNVDRRKLADCIKECFACAQACTACADSCLSEQDVAALAKCIRTNLDCADVCFATGQVLSRHTGYDANLTRAVLEACATACKSCADVCREHEAMDHCASCAFECRNCEQACRELLDALG
ncbi:four-helix bundle copper-binding protein [Glycomyces xiaoerkulensis]|uniref:four-helix bundle copper-binding protein n=1 Tax=Glycomyces xiaoerkulensis TaxID=2038139 RepID=UPI000C25EF94|nr:four-helix bundle copper-binding protein [Glycomyces xiaoerkulensis]